jgi:acyl-CoA reductase-like NAD-dependent aldehyde dehydrogenase
MPPSIDLKPVTRASLERPFQLLIDGVWRPAQSGKTLAVFNPADGRPIATIPAGGKDDVDLAVAAARRAFDAGVWSGMPPGERAKILWRIADLIEVRQAEFAELETLDNGKPVWMSAKVDVPMAVASFAIGRAGAQRSPARRARRTCPANSW